MTVKALLDSHVLFWWSVDHPKLSRPARRVIQDPDNEIYVSAATAWEMATKVRLGKWDDAKPIIADLETVIVDNRFLPLPISVAHARAAGLLANTHGDPFDRVLAAQAQLEDLQLITADPAFRPFLVKTIW